ncbi:MAG: hypothetical protein ACK4GM_02660 [Tabrizicola sp.]
MSDRFPPLRPQASLTGAPSRDRTLPAPAPVDLGVIAAFVFVLAVALL